jgi:hypothetical protein
MAAVAWLDWFAFSDAICDTCAPREHREEDATESPPLNLHNALLALERLTRLDCRAQMPLHECPIELGPVHESCLSQGDGQEKLENEQYHERLVHDTVKGERAAQPCRAAGARLKRRRSTGIGWRVWFGPRGTFKGSVMIKLTVLGSAMSTLPAKMSSGFDSALPICQVHGGRSHLTGLTRDTRGVRISEDRLGNKELVRVNAKIETHCVLRGILSILSYVGSADDTGNA